MNLLTKIAFDLEDARKADKAHRDAGHVHRKGIQLTQGIFGSSAEEVSKRKTSRQSKTMTRAIESNSRDKIIKADKKFNPKTNMFTPQSTVSASTTFGDAKVRVAGGHANELLARAGIDRKKVHPKDKELLNRVVTHHEMNERRAVKEQMKAHGKHLNFEGTSHAAPSVILREHNQLTTMPKTSETKGTREAFKHLRHTGGAEAKIIGSTVKGYTHGESPRFSRHAIKRIDEAMRRRGALGSAGVEQQAKVDGPTLRIENKGNTGDMNRKTRGPFVKGVNRKAHKFSKATSIPHKTLRTTGKVAAGLAGAGLVAAAYKLHKDKDKNKEV